MKTSDFLRQHDACRDGAKWALSISKEMSDVWDAMIEQKKREWLIWTATRPGVFSDRVLCKLPCRFVRETPLADGRKVWDLLTDERSRKAVEVAERYADGKATGDELRAARDAAASAAEAAHNADYDAACAAAYAAAYADYDAAEAVANAAVYAASCAAAYAAAEADYVAANAAYAAANAAYAAANAAYDAYTAANAAAEAAQSKMIAELGNPFRKERVK